MPTASKTKTGRPRGFDPDDALQILIGVFWERGYEGASTLELVSASGLQKASLYAAFGDKRSMYLKALDQYCSDLVEIVESLLHDGRPRHRFERLFANLVARAATGDHLGCFLCAAASDQAFLDADTAEVVRRGFERLETIFDRALLEAVTRRDTRRLRAQSLLASYVALQTLARGGYDAQAMRSIAREAWTQVPG
jgi:AcrR family transcriptional regulator